MSDTAGFEKLCQPSIEFKMDETGMRYMVDRIRFASKVAE
jgi:hypothetical protein